MAKAKREQSELPPIRMVRKGMSLVPADAFSEEMLDAIRFNVPIDIQWTYELTNPKRKKFWAVLNNVVKNCRTPWTNSKAAADSLKHHLGVVDQFATLRGDPIRYPGSLLDLSDEEFDVFYEGAMATLHRITGIDPEGLRRSSAKVQGEREDGWQAQERREREQAAGTDDVVPSREAGDPGPGGEAYDDPDGTRHIPDRSEAATDEQAFDNPDERREHFDREGNERAMVNATAAEAPSNVKSSTLTMPVFNAEAIVDELIEKATALPGSVDERKARVREAGSKALAEWPVHNGFIGTVIHHCERVARGDLRATSAGPYLKSIAPKG